MTESEATNEEQAVEATIENWFGAFAYMAEKSILAQTFERPLELGAFLIWGSPLGQQLASLTLSHLPFSANGEPVPRQLVAVVAKEAADELRTELSTPIDLDAIFARLPEERQAHHKANWRQAQEAGLAPELMLEGFRLFLDNLASEVDVTASDMPYVSSLERMIILLYLMLGWHLASMLVMVTSYGDDDRSRLQGFQRPEYAALVEYVMACYGWGGNRNKALELVRDSLDPELDSERRRKGLRIPGARYGGIESWIEPHNDEPQLMIIGLFEGLEWAANRGLVHILADVPTGKLRNSLKMAATHNLIDGIREANRQLGIGVLPDWLQKGKSQDEIRILKQMLKEVPDYEIRTPDAEPSSVLGMAADKEGLRSWAEDEREREREAFVAETVAQLVDHANLTPRLRLVAKLFDKPDTVIAAKLGEAFGKPVKPGAVRVLRHKLLVKLKETAAQK